MSPADLPPRIITDDPLDHFYWTSGADGRLRIQHCNQCDRFHHPPQPVCPYCHSRDLEPQPVSGKGTVAAFTVNHQEFMPGFEVPFVFAFIEIDEDPTIRLASNIVDVDHAAVTIGMAVQVTFEHNGDWFVPLFTPAQPE